MKTPADIVKTLEQRLTGRWHHWVTGTAHEVPDSDEQPTPVAGSSTWPMVLSLGRPTARDVDTAFSSVVAWAITWREHAAAQRLDLDWETRVVRATRQQLPVRVRIPDMDTAARLAASGWPARLQRARSRWTLLQGEFPTTVTPAVLRATDTMSDIEVDMLRRTALWLREHDPVGLTPRQVPVEGTHAKWLDSRHALLTALSGRAELGLVPRPTRVHFTYLDPAHRAAGGRHHDSLTLGDTASPAYTPRVVIVSENKDTAVLFPAVDGGISVEAIGDAASKLLLQVPWIATAPLVIYWGDIDHDGFEALDTLRSRGLPVVSILMDLATYEQYEDYASITDRKGQALTPRPVKDLPHLTAAERDLYIHLSDPSWGRSLRLEQERIPLDAAVRAVHAAITATLPETPHA